MTTHRARCLHPGGPGLPKGYGPQSVPGRQTTRGNWTAGRGLPEDLPSPPAVPRRSRPGCSLSTPHLAAATRQPSPPSRCHVGLLAAARALSADSPIPAAPASRTTFGGHAARMVRVQKCARKGPVGLALGRIITRSPGVRMAERPTGNQAYSARRVGYSPWSASGEF